MPDIASPAKKNVYSFFLSRLSPPGTQRSPIQAYLRDLRIPLHLSTEQSKNWLKLIESIDLTVPL